MWFCVEVFGFTVFAFGVGRRRRQGWISNTDGHFELAPDEVDEYEYIAAIAAHLNSAPATYEEEECGFGFH